MKPSTKFCLRTDSPLPRQGSSPQALRVSWLGWGLWKEQRTTGSTYSPLAGSPQPRQSSEAQGGDPNSLTYLP